MRHLNIDRWFRKTSTGRLQRLRVSEKAEREFPRRYREIYQHSGPTELVSTLMREEGLSLAAAWDKTKAMFNGPQGEFAPRREIPRGF